MKIEDMLRELNNRGRTITPMGRGALRPKRRKPVDIGARQGAYEI